MDDEERQLNQAEEQPLLQPIRTFNQFTGHADASITQSRRKTQHFLTSKFGHYAILSLVVLDVSCIIADFVIELFTCEKKGPNSRWNEALDALGWVSLVFSCLFMIELLAAIWAFGLQYFNSKFHVFDALVITASFVLDVVLHGTLEEVASLVILLRLWRVFKIIEELSVGAQEKTEGLEAKVKELEKENEELKEELRIFRGEA
ncbi:uncharacterized protein K452DRAFT_248962 [Aplosporella prunicola CBS 121167]|uniref:Voltage-gated hydrogen channel 1 n=1 Tax=Aplosporella prunicola CBS 121167 TaxID=1176127 RepID=A0A6A6BDT2_9PEZI|nr:uncharacterized protein K452DRAFT_248962 [Aplosporella prunicola CBS 121167]KAF2142330.1 hypothetical protein K452DRAFT_248962 [Aplosporella prunicola CBS 121167]